MDAVGDGGATGIDPVPDHSYRGECRLPGEQGVGSHCRAGLGGSPLSNQRGPVRIDVATMQMQAVQTRSSTGNHEWSDAGVSAVRANREVGVVPEGWTTRLLRRQ